MEEPFGLTDHSDNEPTYSVDPVCGMKVDEAKAAGHTSYAGQKFYFCSKICQKTFEAEPGKHLPAR
jgi:Cu+-exporting ATPase